MTIRIPRHLQLAVLAGVILLLFASPASPAGAVPNTYDLDSALDGSDANLGDNLCATAAGNCTLRAAIEQANAHVGGDTILNNVQAAPPGSNIVVQPGTPLPTITDPLTIDLSPKTGSGQFFLDGANAGGGAHGITVESGFSVIRDFTIGNFGGRGIWLKVNNNNQIYGMKLGTNVAGTAVRPNNVGIFIDDTSDNRIGSVLVDNPGNTISGNAVAGVRIIGANATNNFVLTNFIGTNSAGTAALPNGAEGAVIRDATDTTVSFNIISANTTDGLLLDGGSGSVVYGNVFGASANGTVDLGNGGAGVHVVAGTDHYIGHYLYPFNLISGNGGEGVFIEDAPDSQHVVENNTIGTIPTEVSALPNDGAGIRVANSSYIRLGSTIAGNENTIRFNGGAGVQLSANAVRTLGNNISNNTGDGVRISGGTGNEVSQNSIHDNGELGIDIGPNGVTPSDGLGDPDTGANNLQNQPALTAAVLGASTVTVTGTLQSEGTASYKVEFFSSPACDPSASGEGETFLGSTSGTADPLGLLNLNYIHPQALTAGHVITAVTIRTAQDYTSEFSNCVIVAATNDLDGDGILDAADNCPNNANPLQEWSDRNFIDQTPPSTQDDRTWPRSDATGDACDTDDDNDGILDVNEGAGCNTSGPLSPTNRDTDGDRILDGAECALATNPASAASKPTAAACAAFLGVGVSVDTDGDRLFDRVEYCGYNTDRLLLDTDGDQDAFPLNPTPAVNLIRDGCEAASLNNDRAVNSADQLLIALEIAREIDQTLRLVSMDINKDGGVNSGDQLLMVGFIVNAGSCP